MRLTLSDRFLCCSEWGKTDIIPVYHHVRNRNDNMLGLLVFISFLMTSARAEPHVSRRFCVLALGDSLTQGVGSHGSYVDVLFPLVTARLGPHVDLIFDGSHSGPCIPKKPNEHYITSNTPNKKRHEGHCGWSSHALASKYNQLSEMHKCKRFDVVLLLLGHNDAFQVAKLCKLVEGKKWATAVEETCAKRHLAISLFPNLRMLLRMVRRGPATKLFVGINPPTGFPVVDRLLRINLESIANESTVTNSSQTIATVPNDNAVFLVPFLGWTVGKHTFDSTHPNTEGCRLMAESWMAAMELHEVWPVERVVHPNASLPRRTVSFSPTGTVNNADFTSSLPIPLIAAACVGLLIVVRLSRRRSAG